MVGQAAGWTWRLPEHLQGLVQEDCVRPLGRRDLMGGHFGDCQTEGIGPAGASGFPRCGYLPWVTPGKVSLSGAALPPGALLRPVRDPPPMGG